MAEGTHYPNAPLNEAVLDIRVEGPTQEVLTELEQLPEDIRNRFPDRKARHQAELKLKIGSEEGTGWSEVIDGYMFYSTSKDSLVQFRLDGFTFNKLRPYNSWAEFSSEGRELWERYCIIAKPKVVTRLALRYINELEFPFNLPADLRNPLKIGPGLPEGLPSDIEGFLLRLNFRYEQYNANVILNTITRPVKEGDHIFRVVLDIDVYTPMELAPDDSTQLWSVFENLRRAKNETFFACVSEEWREANYK